MIWQAPMPSTADNGIGSEETKGMLRGVARVSAVRQSDMGSFLDGNRAKSSQVSFKTCLTVTRVRVSSVRRGEIVSGALASLSRDMVGLLEGGLERS